MENKKHKEEILRWANCPDGTKVWVKADIVTKWIMVNTPDWLPDRIYIVNDEWQLLRRSQADGKQLQRRLSKNHEFEDADIESCVPIHLKNWRIKPEPVYEWQWICKIELLVGVLIVFINILFMLIFYKQ